MKITKKFDRNEIEKLLKEKMIQKQIHPHLPLTVYNYTREAQFCRNWNEITLQARGLVLDDDFNVIARPLPKFFNYEELSEIPNENYEVFEKLDGSMALIFWYKNSLMVCTRGSFISEQACVATQILLSKYIPENLNKEYTWICEIIYPQNRIVVNYGKEKKLVILAAVHTETGKEMSYEDLLRYADSAKMPVVRKFSFEKLESLKTKNWENYEGFVIRFESGTRIKLKLENYLKLHRILTECSSYDIWQSLKEKDCVSEELLQNVPDEFDSWVKKIEEELRNNYDRIDKEAKEKYEEVCYRLSSITEDYNKQFAVIVEKEKMRHLLFYLNRKYVSKYREAIWKMIKPKYEKPFKNDNDE